MNSKYLKTAEFCRSNWKKETEHILRVADEVCENYFLFDMPWGYGENRGTGYIQR